MALSSISLILLLLLIVLISCKPAASSCYTSLICFGDSIPDTGNYLLSLDGKPDRIANPPYGQTYFQHPTGRFSDGRVILDFIAEALEMPHLPPFLGIGSRDCDCNYGHGVNFAVGGATALDNKFFTEQGLYVDWTNYSLSVQIQCFKQLLPSLCASHSAGCSTFMNKTLFLVGEIGANDYNQPFFQDRSLDEIRTYVPKIIETISTAINELIDMGAKTLLVPSNFPLGCAPPYLTVFPGNSSEYYEAQSGCIKWLNEFAEYHNMKLLEELDRIREHHPDISIIYLDYYSASLTLFRYPHHFGFGPDHLTACCGGGGLHNYNPSAMCGTEGASVCSDPSRYISWDGLHFTEAANRAIVSGLFKNGSSTHPAFSNKCPTIEHNANNTYEPPLFSLYALLKIVPFVQRFP